MFICSGDIALRSIVKSDLELIRKWRNSPEVSAFMHFRDFISEDDQLRWFAGLNPQSDLYFLLFRDEKPVGVINLRHINWQDGSSEAGIFMGEDTVKNTSFPVRATVLLMKTAFHWLGLRQLFAKVSMRNIPALQMNEVLGYRKLSGPSLEFENYACSRENFLRSKLIDTVGRAHIELFAGDEWLLHRVKDHPDFEVAEIS